MHRARNFCFLILMANSALSSEVKTLSEAETTFVGEIRNAHQQIINSPKEVSWGFTEYKIIRKILEKLCLRLEKIAQDTESILEKIGINYVLINLKISFKYHKLVDTFGMKKFVAASDLSEQIMVYKIVSQSTNNVFDAIVLELKHEKNKIKYQRSFASEL